MLIHLFHPYLLSAYIMTGTVIGSKNVTGIRQMK